jgi:hypothetical protein
MTIVIVVVVDAGGVVVVDVSRNHFGPECLRTGCRNAQKDCSITKYTNVSNSVELLQLLLLLLSWLSPLDGSSAW